MPYDPYTADSGYVRFHLVRMVADKLPLWGLTTEEVVELLEALSAYVARGSTPPDEEEKEDSVDENPVIVIPGGGYI